MTTAVAPARQLHEPGPLESLRLHWVEYLCEAGALGAFMLAACVVATVLEHPMSDLHQAIASADVRRAIAGIAMGLTAIGIIKSPAGQRSGAHMNPAFTLTFFLLRKVRRWDAVFYTAAQFTGGAAGVLLAKSIVGIPLAHTAVNYAVTVPGPLGNLAALAGEWIISMLLMLIVLIFANSARLTKWTPYVAGIMIAVYITLEAPLSGMSMNPARSVASAFSAGLWTSIWIYFAGPLGGMLTGAGLYVATRGRAGVYCAKYDHCNSQPCIFRCDFHRLRP